MRSASWRANTRAKARRGSRSRCATGGSWPRPPRARPGASSPSASSPAARTASGWRTRSTRGCSSAAAAETSSTPTRRRLTSSRTSDGLAQRPTRPSRPREPRPLRARSSPRRGGRPLPGPPSAARTPPESATARAHPPSWDLAKGSNVLWKTALPGLANSSPIVWGERVYLTSGLGHQGRSHLPHRPLRRRGSRCPRRDRSPGTSCASTRRRASCSGIASPTRARRG